MSQLMTRAVRLSLQLVETSLSCDCETDQARTECNKAFLTLQFLANSEVIIRTSVQSVQTLRQYLYSRVVDIKSFCFDSKHQICMIKLWISNKMAWLVEKQTKF